MYTICPLIAMKELYHLLTVAVCCVSILSSANAQDCFDKDNAEPFLAFLPLNQMFVPLGRTSEGYQYGVMARILDEEDSRTGKVHPIVLATKDEVGLYFAAPLKNGSYEMVEVGFHFDGDDFSRLKDKELGDVIIWDRIEGNKFLWKSHYIQESDDAFIYKLSELQKFEEDANKEGWNSKENRYEYDKYRVCHEEMEKPEDCIHQIRSVGEHALKFEKAKELLDNLSKAYSEGGRAYLASVITAPKIRKDVLEKMHPQQPIQSPIKKKAKSKDKCVFHIECKNEAKIISHAVRVENSSKNYDKFFWTLKLKNTGGTPQEYSIKIKLYDKDGFMVFDTLHTTRQIEVGETASIGDNRLINIGLWPTIKTVEFNIERY